MAGRNRSAGGKRRDTEAESTSTSTSTSRTTVAARLNVNINEATAAQLRRIADRRKISYTEAVRRAVAVLDFVEEENEAGHVVQAVDPARGTARELVLIG